MLYTLCWINNKTNICENVTVSSKHISQCQQVDGFLIVDLNDIGGGGIGDIWDGTKLNKPPEPEQPQQPTTSGIEEI